jgi:hypothetical protein
VDVELGDDADGALGADEELFEVEARIVFVNFGGEVEDLAVGEDCL